MGTFARTILLATLVAFGAGCAAQPRTKPATTSEPRATSKQPYDFKSEGKVPPVSSSSATVEADVEEMPIEGSAVDVTEAEAPPPPPPDTTAAARPDSTAEGFRVQVFASADREVAENARMVAEQRLGVPAYIDLDAGMYKVRVGNYLRRPEAEAAMATMRGHYYPDAWIVPTRVVVPRTP